MNVKVVPLPHGVNEFVAESYGEYTVLLKSHYKYEQKHRNYLHEMEHIEEDDLYAKDSADIIEHKRHSRQCK